MNWYRYRPDLCDSQSDASEPQADLCGGGETQDELARLRAAYEHQELQVCRLKAEIDHLQTELEMWRGAAGDRRGFVLRDDLPEYLL